MSASDSVSGMAPHSESPQPPRKDISATIIKRYKDAYREAHAVVTVGTVIKVLDVLFGVIVGLLFVGFLVDSGASRLPGQFNIPVLGMAIALLCVICVPVYVLGILVSSHGQMQLAALDTAVNSSRHLSDAEVELILATRFFL